MTNQLAEIFKDKKLVDKVRKRLPYLFQLAELESRKNWNGSRLTSGENLDCIAGL